MSNIALNQVAESPREAAGGPHVLVTGAAGYLGSVLCERLLRSGYRVTALDNLHHGQGSIFHLCAYEQFEFVRADVRDETAMKQALRAADAIIPLAAIVGAPACERDPMLARSVNLDAVALLDRLRSRSQAIIFPTTNSGYGAKSGEVFCTEETALEPVSLYGRTKVEAEARLLASPNVVTLRLATVFGVSPRMRIDLLVNSFVYAAVKYNYLVIFEKDFKRNYVHIQDVADCFEYCVRNQQRMAGHPYNVGLESANLSKEELALRVKQFVPGLYIHYAPIGSDPDKRNYIVSNQRLRAAGFEAQRSLDVGIRELLKGYRLIGRSPFENV